MRLSVPAPQLTLMTRKRTPNGRALLTAALCLFIGIGAGAIQPAAAATRTSRATAKGTSGKSTARKTTVKRQTTKAYSSKASRARRAKLARARVAARVRMARELAVPRYKTDATGAQVPDLHAAAAIIYNPQTHQVLWEENSQDKRSIASITKVMTATVFVESEPDMDELVTIERSDTYAASTTYLRTGYQVAVRDLLHLLLIASDNAAARALARTSPWGPSGFIARMNEKATELGLQSTTYADPSGLDPANVSSAYDMARLIAYASSDERISEIMRKQEHTALLGRRTVTVRSTNRLLARSDMEKSVLGGKTGFIGQAGYCLATLLKLPDANQPIAVVVLGARSNAGRFAEVRNLISWMSTKAKDVLAKDTK